MSYVHDAGCVKAATKILGDKWTPLLLRKFFASEKVRFCELQEGTDSINPRTLSARLVKLEEQGIIEKVGDTKRCEYVLSAKGRDFLPVLKQMEAWGQKYPEKTSENSQTAVIS